MAQGQATEQEPRSQLVHARVTAAEKRDVVLVAAYHESTESDVLRDWTIADITAEAARIRESKNASVVDVAGSTR